MDKVKKGVESKRVHSRGGGELKNKRGRSGFLDDFALDGRDANRKRGDHQERDRRSQCGDNTDADYPYRISGHKSESGWQY